MVGICHAVILEFDAFLDESRFIRDTIQQGKMLHLCSCNSNFLPFARNGSQEIVQNVQLLWSRFQCKIYMFLPPFFQRHLPFFQSDSEYRSLVFLLFLLCIPNRPPCCFLSLFSILLLTCTGSTFGCTAGIECRDSQYAVCTACDTGLCMFYCASVSINPIIPVINICPAAR